MRKKYLWAGIVVTQLIFAMAVIGCATKGSPLFDPSLNGTWLAEKGNFWGTQYAYVLYNGNFESSDGVTPNNKGTYSVNNGKIIFKTEYVYRVLPGIGMKWYSKDELTSYMMANDGAEYVDLIGSLFREVVYDYSIDGNTLTLTYDFEDEKITDIYTKNPLDYLFEE